MKKDNPSGAWALVALLGSVAAGVGVFLSRYTVTIQITRKGSKTVEVEPEEEAYIRPEYLDVFQIRFDDGIYAPKNVETAVMEMEETVDAVETEPEETVEETVEENIEETEAPETVEASVEEPVETEKADDAEVAEEPAEVETADAANEAEEAVEVKTEDAAEEVEEAVEAEQPIEEVKETSEEEKDTSDDDDADDVYFQDL